MSNSKVYPSTLYSDKLDTLIVWTIKTTDMALSFQEGQGCSEIMYIISGAITNWKGIHQRRSRSESL